MRPADAAQTANATASRCATLLAAASAAASAASGAVASSHDHRLLATTTAAAASRSIRRERAAAAEGRVTGVAGRWLERGHVACGGNAPAAGSAGRLHSPQGAIAFAGRSHAMH